jgi:predicted nucleic acid-binding protein
LSVYLDTSVLLPLVVPDAHMARAEAFMATDPSGIMVSDFAAAEFASGVSRLVRMSEIDEAEARQAFIAFDGWVLRAAVRLPVLGEDVRAAEAELRRLEVRLAAPDVLHLVIARRLTAPLATFDVRMHRTAEALGIPVLDI